MSQYGSPLLSYSAEVQDYLRACERLLAAAAVRHKPPFSEEELQLVEYYINEVARMHAALTHK